MRSWGTIDMYIADRGSGKLLAAKYASFHASTMATKP